MAPDSTGTQLFSDLELINAFFLWKCFPLVMLMNYVFTLDSVFFKLIQLKTQNR